VTYRIGFDVGGTFTDFSIIDDVSGRVDYHKVPSTPDDPSRAIETGLTELIQRLGLDPREISHLGHGTTVATNMAIERRGARTGLITTRGFRDVLEIGRQTRPHLYDYRVRRPEPLIPRHLRLEVDERTMADGSIRTELDEPAVSRAARELRDAGVEAVVICFLHSYRNPANELRARELVKQVMPDIYISTSSEILPEFREFERLSTTVLNAYMGPRMSRYLERLLSRVSAIGVTANLDTIHSNGGLMSVAAVREMPVRTCVSGPAAGVIGAAEIGRQAGFYNLVTFDVGGTSTDVSVVVNGKPLFASSCTVADYPVKTPMVDIHVIGAGGGSIAAVDDAGALKVGPRSAGADPGPVAYALGGTEPTITDANISLGRLDQGALLDGRLPIDASAARAAIKVSVADRLNISTEHAANGILRIAIANMNRAIQAVSTEKGHDIRDFALVAYGGAGPLHAGDLAREAGISTIIVPLEPGTLCARGILLSDITMDFVRSELMIASTETWNDVLSVLLEMCSEAKDWLQREAVPEKDRALLISVDARYDGQNYEVGVDLEEPSEKTVEAFVTDFKRRHRQEYGYDIDGREVEIVNCRVRAIGTIHKQAASFEPDTSVDARTGSRRVYFGEREGWLDAPVYRRNRLAVGTKLRGPAILEEMSSTTIVHPDQHIKVDDTGNLIIALQTLRNNANNTTEAPHATL
jgi:N-methylhydantoinase A